MTDDVHPMWTDDELDATLSALHAPVDKPDLRGARVALYAELDGPKLDHPQGTHIVHRRRRKPRRNWTNTIGLNRGRPPGREGAVLGRFTGGARVFAGRRWVLGAVVVLVVAGVVVGQELLPGTATPVASAASLTLRRAADATIHERDPVLRPGQYRYIRTDAWVTDGVQFAGPPGYLAYRTENITELWVPADQSDNWMQRRTPTGKRVWVVGTEQQADAAGFQGSGPGPRQDVAPCGDFFPTSGAAPSCADMARMAGWQVPTPAWLATLPTDPQAMLDRLRADAPRNGRGDAELVVYVADALRSGLVPARVRAVLYQALALLPDLTITQRVANLAGRTGVAMGIDDRESPTRQEIIIDPHTGEYIGERTVQLRSQPGAPAGSVSEYSSVTTTVVDALGAQH